MESTFSADTEAYAASQAPESIRYRKHKASLAEAAKKEKAPAVSYGPSSEAGNCKVA